MFVAVATPSYYIYILVVTESNRTFFSWTLVLLASMSPTVFEVRNRALFKWAIISELFFHGQESAASPFFQFTTAKQNKRASQLWYRIKKANQPSSLILPQLLRFIRNAAQTWFRTQRKRKQFSRCRYSISLCATWLIPLISSFAVASFGFFFPMSLDSLAKEWFDQFRTFCISPCRVFFFSFGSYPYYSY